MRHLISFTLSVLLLAPAAEAADDVATLDQIRSTGKIRIGFRQAAPPIPLP